MPSINDILKRIKHPVFKDAKIELDVTWVVDCARCGARHKFGTSWTELDPCCSKPTFKRYK